VIGICDSSAFANEGCLMLLKPDLEVMRAAVLLDLLEVRGL
jgi:hypothetical protein